MVYRRFIADLYRNFNHHRRYLHDREQKKYRLELFSREALSRCYFREVFRDSVLDDWRKGFVPLSSYLQSRKICLGTASRIFEILPKKGLVKVEGASWRDAASPSCPTDYRILENRIGIGPFKQGPTVVRTTKREQSCRRFSVKQNFHNVYIEDESFIESCARRKISSRSSMNDRRVSRMTRPT